MASQPQDYAYLGLRGPSSSTAEINAMQFVIDATMSAISTATVVKVVRAPYDAEGNAIAPGAAVPIGYVDVQPMVNQVDGYGNATPHGTVYRLSYHRYQGGNGSFISDPAVGDIGKMVVADRDTSAVRATNKVSNPGSGRVFSKSDGTYFGATQSVGAPPQWCTFTSAGFEVHDRNGNSIVMGPAGITIADGHGNSIVTASAGITITVSPGNTVVVKQGAGTVEFVELSTMSPSTVLKAD